MNKKRLQVLFAILLLVCLPIVISRQQTVNEKNKESSSSAKMHQVYKLNGTFLDEKILPTDEKDETHRDAGMIEAERIPELAPIPWVKTISHLPTDESLLAKAHGEAKQCCCEAIPANQLVYESSFQPFSLPDQSGEQIASYGLVSRRLPVFSIGMSMSDADQDDLPLLSENKILGFLQGHFITMQVQVHRDPITDQLFLHHGCLAGVVHYADSQVTQALTEGLSKTLANYRSLGLFLVPGQEPVAQNLRTLVLLNRRVKTDVVQPTSVSTDYEYIFLHLKVDTESAKTNFAINTFATSEKRTRLHYLKPAIVPQSHENCSMVNTLYFTEYSHGGLYPVASASRGIEYNSHATHIMQQGDFENLPQVLDALIDKHANQAQP